MPANNAVNGTVSKSTNGQPKSITPQNPHLDEELGVTSPLPVGSWDSFISSFGTAGEIGRTGLVSLDNLVEMRRKDGQARALLRLLTLPIRKAMEEGEWIEPEEGDAEQEVEFANLMWNTAPQNGGMTTPMTKVLRNVLLALSDGFSVLEEVRHVPDQGPLKGKITLRKLAYRDSRTVKFKVDDQGGFDGVRQVTTLNGKTIDVIIPKDKVWFYTCNDEENPFYGVPAFEAAWFHYDIKRKLYYIAHLAAQFAAVPGRSGKVPRNFDVTQLRQFKAALANFAFNTAMTYPEGYEVEFHQNTGTFDFLKLIDHHNRMMSRSVLAGFIDTENRPALVDINNGDPQADMFVVALECIMNEIAESWTHHLMPKYIDWNFGTHKYPVYRFGTLTDSAKDAIKEIFTAVVTSSVLNCTPEFVREMEMKLAERFALDIDYKTIEAAEKEAALAAQEQAQVQAEQDAQMQAQAQAAPPGAPGQPPGKPGFPPGKPGGGGFPPGKSGAPLPPGTPKQPVPIKPVAASRNEDIDELVSMAQDLLERHAGEDLWSVAEDDDG